MSVVTAGHTVKAFDADLTILNGMIVEMGGRAAGQVVQAVEALSASDSKSAKRVVKSDAELDCLQMAIEQKAVATIATRQPMAVDLREVIAVLRIAHELERIGDLAKNIGKRVVALDGGNLPRQSLRGVLHMSGVATRLLMDVIESYSERDSNKAMKVWNGDKEIDALYKSLFRDLLTDMTEQPGDIVAAIHVLFCAKNIERVGDHATNIAESVYYAVEGRTLGDLRPKVESINIATFADRALLVMPTT